MTRPRKREFLLALITLSLALFAWYGGDVPEDRVLQPLPQPRQLCLRTHLRWMIQHRTESGFTYHQCAYGPVWLAVAQETGH